MLLEGVDNQFSKPIRKTFSWIREVEGIPDADKGQILEKTACGLS